MARVVAELAGKVVRVPEEGASAAFVSSPMHYVDMRGRQLAPTKQCYLVAKGREAEAAGEDDFGTAREYGSSTARGLSSPVDDLRARAGTASRVPWPPPVGAQALVCGRARHCPRRLCCSCGCVICLLARLDTGSDIGPSVVRRSLLAFLAFFSLPLLLVGLPPAFLLFPLSLLLLEAALLNFTLLSCLLLPALLLL
jgi:hypothetical protein